MKEFEDLNAMLRRRNCRRVLLGMSGGLDSTYAAWYLKQLGYEVEGAVLKMFEEMSTENAEIAAAQAGVPLRIVDAVDAFRENVINNFVSEYASARTPNPCVRCNRFVKIKTLCDYAKENGFDHVSTGHYVRIGHDPENGRWYAARSDDDKKDQSYFLWQLTQEELSMLLTPLYHMDKKTIRMEAEELGFTSAALPESQDICFIPEGDYVSFVEKRIGTFPKGDFLNQDGKRIGTHRGIIHYTIGQRKGLGIAMGEPVFVSKINPMANTVTLSPTGGEFGDTMIISQINEQKILPHKVGQTLDALVKIRNAAKPQPCSMQFLEGNRAKVHFMTPARAITPGQSAVFYDPMNGGCDVLFGGLVDCSEKVNAKGAL